jgi:hypothetical protein
VVNERVIFGRANARSPRRFRTASNVAALHEDQGSDAHNKYPPDQMVVRLQHTIVAFCNAHLSDRAAIFTVAASNQAISPQGYRFFTRRGVVDTYRRIGG